MTRFSRTALLMLTVGTVVCGCNIVMHVEVDQRGVPIELRQRLVEGFVHLEFRPSEFSGNAYTSYGFPPDPGPEVYRVADIPFDSRLPDRTFHMRFVFLDADGRPLYEGDGEATIADGATLTLILSPTGPQ